MSIMNHIYINQRYTIEHKICKFCGKHYESILVEQTPGFKDTEEEKCPYCGGVNRVSMEYEFSTQKCDGSPRGKKDKNENSNN